MPAASNREEKEGTSEVLILKADRKRDRSTGRLGKEGQLGSDKLKGMGQAGLQLLKGIDCRDWT